MIALARKIEEGDRFLFFKLLVPSRKCSDGNLQASVSDERTLTAGKAVQEEKNV